MWLIGSYPFLGNRLQLFYLFVPFNRSDFRGAMMASQADFVVLDASPSV